MGDRQPRSILDPPHHHPSRAPIARSGPYRYLSHPNYAVTIIETFVLPLAFGALALACIMTALWWVVLSVKIKLEDEALADRWRLQVTPTA